MSRYHRRWNGRGWEQSRWWLAQHPNCELRLPGCTGRADTVDHIVPLSRGGALFNPANWRAACRHCNCSRKDGAVDPPLSPRWR